MRRVSGYNLDQLIGSDELNLAKFVIGSEGTLLTITEAELKLVDKPKYKGLAVIHFDSLIASMEATVSILELDPSAVEHVGEIILDEARKHNEYKNTSINYIINPLFKSNFIPRRLYQYIV